MADKEGLTPKRTWARPSTYKKTGVSLAPTRLSRSIKRDWRTPGAFPWAFRFADDLRIEIPFEDDWGPGEMLHAGRTKLGRLKPAEHFLYEFDFGDSWIHLCTVGEERVDPLEMLGMVPPRSLAYWGWGDIPDQYRRRWEDDDGEAPVPPDPGFSDLPPLLPDWSTD